jgi:hypothetical protein
LAHQSCGFGVERNGFDWWPGDFRVCVRAYRRQDDQLPEAWWICIRTDFLKDAPVDDERFVSLVAMTSRFSTSTYAWVYPPAAAWAEHGEKQTSPRLWFSSSAYVTPKNVDWMPSFLARMRIMQPINAQLQAKVMPGMLTGGAPDVSLPDKLAGAGFNEILEEATQAYVPIGAEASRWIGTNEFFEIAELWGRSDLCFGNGDADGLTLDASIGNDTALIRLRTDEKRTEISNVPSRNSLLCLGDERPRNRCTTRKRNEFPSPHAPIPTA